MSPVKSRSDSGWSSVGTARWLTLGSGGTPLGSAHDASTPSRSSRRSQWRRRAWCSWTTKRGAPSAPGGAPSGPGRSSSSGSGVAEKSRLALYLSSLSLIGVSERPAKETRGTSLFSAAIMPLMASQSANVEVELEGRRLKLSNLDKVLYPESGFTKGQVIDYYVRVSSALLPHLRRRPLTLKRYPNGVDAGSFYEKQCPSHRPDWVRTVSIPSERTTGKEVNYCTADDLPTLAWLANLAAIELHPLLARADGEASGSSRDAVNQPTMVAFDLDPGPPADVTTCAEVACWLRAGLY